MFTKICNELFKINYTKYAYGKKIIKIFSFWNVGVLKSQECFKRIIHEIQNQSPAYFIF